MRTRPQLRVNRRVRVSAFFKWSTRSRSLLLQLEREQVWKRRALSSVTESGTMSKRQSQRLWPAEQLMDMWTINFSGRMFMLGCGADNAQSHCGKLWQKSAEKKHLKLQARRQRVKKVMKMLRGVPKTHVLGQPYSVLFSRFMMDFNQNVQKPWVFEAIDFIGANAMSIKTRPLTGAVTLFMSWKMIIYYT